MKILNIHIAGFAVFASLLFMAGGCTREGDFSGENQVSGNRIVVGGVENNDMSVELTKGVSYDAETVSWLRQPLKNGLDITYGLYDAVDRKESVAILKLCDSDGAGGNDYDIEGDYAVYSFKYRAAPHGDAIWYDNGPHYFQGLYVPDRIRYGAAISEVEIKAPGLTTDQHDDTDTGTDEQLGNYTLLSHYLGMPADYKVTATIERIKLPFRHRLARVIAFVLIDPAMNTSLKGYYIEDSKGNKIVNPDHTQNGIIFSHVGVLEGVHDTEDGSGHHTLTPAWTVARTVVPHFEGEKGSWNYSTQTNLDDNFKVYYKADEGKSGILFPTSQGWKAVHDAAGHNGYTEINYGKVPVYDVIVRPTYTDLAHVMYDEDLTAHTKQWYANQTNQIKFELDLDNGLSYAKTFTFDLNANFQTVVYLQISREHIDYNSSGAEVWINSNHDDGWYGVDNENGNTLSMAGSSWQRAYRTCSVGDDKVTDGDFYNNTSESVGQYLGDNSKWANLLLTAYQGGEHHGDYFILDNDITIDATLIPKDFVFTGHLDAQDHTITLTNSGRQVYKRAESLEELYTESAGVYTAYPTPEHLYKKHVTPAVYWDETNMTLIDGVYYEPSTVHYVTDGTYTEEEAYEINRPHQIEDENGKQPGEDGYIPTYPQDYTPVVAGSPKPPYWDISEGVSHTPGEDIKEPEVITYPEENPITLDLLLHGTELFLDDQGETPFINPAALYQKSHLSPAYLFTGLDGTYTTAQENAANPYAKDSAGNFLVQWEANVHKETNKSTVWVPTLGYRAEVLNLKVAGGTLFPTTTDPETGVTTNTPSPYTGNVQNCYNGATPIPNNTPNIPRYN